MPVLIENLSGWPAVVKANRKAFVEFDPVAGWAKTAFFLLDKY